jgi:Flp pilus assembly protein TadD
VATLLFAAVVSAAELYQQGSSLFQTGKFEEAAARFEQARQLTPQDARVLKALGTSYAAFGDHERASEPLERSCRIDSGLEDVCYYHARNLYALNRFESAIAVLRRLLRNDRHPWRIHLGIAQASEGLGRAEEA